MAITKILYMLWVGDMERAARFYRDVMGLAVKSQSPHWSELTLGDSTVALHIGGNEERRMTALSFEVDNIDAACQEIGSSGGIILNPPHECDIPGLQLADIADPDGNQIQLGHPQS